MQNLFFKNGDKYKGFVQDGKFEGQGEYKFQNQDVYIGKFKNGLFEGDGKFMTKDYELSGNFQQGKIKQAKIVYNDGLQFDGFLNEDYTKKQGKLQLSLDEVQYNNVSILLVNLKMINFLKENYKKKDLFMKVNSRIIKCMVMGKQFMKIMNRIKFFNGMKDGDGFYKFKDGSEYDGKFEKDQIQGQGQMISKDVKYLGQFINGKYDGKGEIQYTDNNQKVIYKGQFKEHFADGQGQLLVNDTVYDGQFKQNMKHGQCKFQNQDKKTYEGYFQYNFEKEDFANYGERY